MSSEPTNELVILQPVHGCRITVSHPSSQAMSLTTVCRARRGTPVTSIRGPSAPPLPAVPASPPRQALQATAVQPPPSAWRHGTLHAAVAPTAVTLPVSTAAVGVAEAGWEVPLNKRQKQQ